MCELEDPATPPPRARRPTCRASSCCFSPSSPRSRASAASMRDSRDALAPSSSATLLVVVGIRLGLSWKFGWVWLVRGCNTAPAQEYQRARPPDSPLQRGVRLARHRRQLLLQRRRLGRQLVARCAQLAHLLLRGRWNTCMSALVCDTTADSPTLH